MGRRERIFVSSLVLLLSVLVGCYQYQAEYLRTTLNWFGLGSTQLHVFPTSFIFSPRDSIYRRVGGLSTNRTADTTAVVLNWSRFENVVKITALFCDPVLENTLHAVVVWNNNPNPLSKFVCITCTPFDYYERPRLLLGFLGMYQGSTKYHQLPCERILQGAFHSMRASTYTILFHSGL